MYSYRNDFFLNLHNIIFDLAPFNNDGVNMTEILNDNPFQNDHHHRLDNMGTEIFGDRSLLCRVIVDDRNLHHLK